MAPTNGMHGSETLNKEIFGEAPNQYALRKQIESALRLYSPDILKKSPEAQDALARIESLSGNIESLAKLEQGTRANLVSLYMETVAKNHMSDYAQQVAILELHQRDRVASLLGASNDGNFSQAA